MNLLISIVTFFPLWLFRSNLEAGEVLLFFVLLFILPVFLCFKILNAKLSWSVSLFKTKFNTKTFFIAFLMAMSLDHNLGLWGLAQIIGFENIEATLFGIVTFAAVFLLITILLALNFQTTLKTFVSGVLAIIAANLLFGEKDIRKLEGSNFVFVKAPKDEASRSNTNLGGPTVVIILDEMNGIEGIDLDQPNGPETYRSSRALFKDFGFKTYGSAYSIYPHTFQSISAILNLVVDVGDTGGFGGENPTYGYNYLLASNKYFDQSGARQIEVFQTYHLNFCQHRRVYRCNTFTSFERPDGKIENFNSGLLSQVVANYKFNTNSVAGHYLHSFLLAFGTIDGLGFPYHDKAAFENNLIKLQKRIIASPSDRLLFAHYMVPHRPFGFTKECTYQWPDKKLIGRTVAKHRTQHHLEIMCVNKFLRSLLDGLRSAGVLDQLTIVILSDHGSRIGGINPLRPLHGRLVALHSSLFAIRAPGVEPGYDTELHSIQYLFSKYLNIEHHEQVESHRLARRDRNGKRIRMPEFAKVDSSNSGNDSQPW